MEWCLAMPKIELHAHLNGSIRDSTLLELAKVLGEKGIIDFADVEHVIMKKVRSLTECFRLFDLIHTLTTDHETVTRITKEKNEAVGMSKRSYMEAVVDGLRAVDAVDVSLISSYQNPENSRLSPCVNGACTGKERRKIHVRLLLSIDRRETTASAMETVQLALEMRDLGVVGIDLSGNPVVGQWQTFVPPLEYAKEQGLRVTLHCGEVPNQKEIQAMLEFHPHRIGHACCLGEEEWRCLKASKIPVEICLSSNVMTRSVSSINDHHFVDLYNASHPLLLCTDDSGVFSTSLTQEYALASSTFGLGKAEMFHLAQSAIDFIFAEDCVKTTLKERFDSASRKFMLQDSIDEAAHGNSFVAHG
ncbi:adenosine deaminase-like protein isoform X1 [Cinnamomum micranthum f. kanehirae]|uniref:Adenosine deaminase-like protein isoform X1 n=1 Tax=Cinnamomum micranthum f. kanehirae TaxID=337451 RepID=A0A3S3N6Q1_9MAGN|nr:adenosine deaminase-like protein isoform X1 [Cinnamomum micranthum f. kanehirae]